MTLLTAVAIAALIFGVLNGGTAGTVTVAVIIALFAFSAIACHGAGAPELTGLCIILALFGWL